jgi:hypothetical protein
MTLTDLKRLHMPKNYSNTASLVKNLSMYRHLVNSYGLLKMKNTSAVTRKAL